MRGTNDQQLPQMLFQIKPELALVSDSDELGQTKCGVVELNQTTLAIKREEMLEFSEAPESRRSNSGRRKEAFVYVEAAASQ